MCQSKVVHLMAAGSRRAREEDPKTRHPSKIHSPVTYPSPNTIQPSTSTDEVTSDPLFKTVIRVKPFTPAILEDVPGQARHISPPNLTQAVTAEGRSSGSPRKLIQRKLYYY